MSQVPVNADPAMPAQEHHWASMDGSPTAPQPQASSPHNGSTGNPLNGEPPLSPTRGDHDESRISPGGRIPGQKTGPIFREKQPNKVYVGGLPEHTRQEDLQSCFGKLGNITSIELKLGYGFVEFDSREAAEESVAKYHEGYFMGNKIRVELSHGGGKTAKFAGEPGACFKCGQQGHWARECPNHVVTIGGKKPYSHENSLLDRISQPRELGPPTRDYPPYRDDYNRSGYGGPSHFPAPQSTGPPRERQYGHNYTATREARDYRRPPSPPRDYRDYPAGPPVRSARDDDFYRRDYRGPPPHVPPSRYENRLDYYPADYDTRDGPGYSRPGYNGPPAHAGPRETYDRRGPPPGDRYAYPVGPPPRARTPPPVAARREEFERPPRDYAYPAAEFRGRPTSPPHTGRYPDYPRNGSGIDPPAGRYSAPRRRSASPVPRSANGHYRSYPNDPGPPDSIGYAPGSGPSYGAHPAGYSAGNGYPSPSGNGPPAASLSSAPPQVRSGPGGSGGGRPVREERDYPTRPPADRNGRDAGDLGPGGGPPYHRRP